MNKERAKEISCSPVMANVTYNGEQIYIENVNENNQTANIHFCNKPSSSQEVSLTSLQEH